MNLEKHYFSRFESRNGCFFLGALSVAFFLPLATMSLNEGIWWGDDAACYMMQADSIQAGSRAVEEVRSANEFIVIHSSRVIGPVLYPWGYPLILAVVKAICPADDMVPKVINVICYSFFLSRYGGHIAKHTRFLD